MDILWQVALTLLGGGTIGGLIGTLIQRGRHLERFSQLEEDMKILKSKQEAQDIKMTTIDRDTDVRLTRIETDLQSVKVTIVDVAKDVKQILKQRIIRDEDYYNYD